METGSETGFLKESKIGWLPMKWRSLEESTPGTDTRSLRDIFAERKHLIAKYVPPETQAVHARVIADLKGKHLAEATLAAGSKAPPSPGRGFLFTAHDIEPRHPEDPFRLLYPHKRGFCPPPLRGTAGSL